MPKPKVEPNHDLVFSEESFIAIRRDGELIGIESQNGHIIRYTTKETTREDSRKILGVDKVKSL